MGADSMAKLVRPLLLLAILLSACGGSAAPASEVATQTVADVSTNTPDATATDVPPTSTSTPTETNTPIPSDTPTPTIVPTYAVLRGKVLPDKLSCRFGPGADYLYKFGVFKSTTVEVLGRMEHSNWVLIRAIGGTNRCWVNGGPEYLQLDGSIDSLAPTDPHIVIAWSYIYTNGLSGVSASRNGNVVTVSWNGIRLNAGDDSEQTPYIVEAWTCQDGEYVFYAYGSYSNAVEIIDEGGCGFESHARVFAAEKHGYTPYVEVPWPATD
jgi:hypothetical protein